MNVKDWTSKQLREHIEDNIAFVDQMTTIEYKVFQAVRRELRERVSIGLL